MALKRMKREERIEQILKCTLDLIGQKSIDSIRTAEIAAAAGITEGALFKYFSTKDEIFESIMSRYIGTSHPLRTAEEIETVEQFRQFIDDYLSSMITPTPQRIAYLRLLLQISMARHELAFRKYEQVVDGFWLVTENRIEYGKRHWGFRKDVDAATQSRLLHLSLLMFFMEQEVFDAKSIEAFDMNKVKKTVIDNFFHILQEI